MKRTLGVLLAACLAGVLPACGEDLADGDSPASAGGTEQSITVGSANFPENALLAEIYAGALRAAGLEVTTKLNVGSREVLFPALEQGEITVLPEYTGALLAYLTKGQASAKAAAEQVTELEAALPAGLTVLEPSAAQDQETVTCTRQVVDEYGLTSLADLGEVSGEIVLGGPPELPQREGFLSGLKSEYGIEFADFRPLDVAGPLTVSALKSGKVDCANLFSTQSAIAANGFVSLADPEGVIESEAVIPLVAEPAATPAVTEALDAVSSALTTENLRDMVKRIEVDKDDAAAVADEFLREAGLA